MEHVTEADTVQRDQVGAHDVAVSHRPAHQAHSILHFAYVLVPTLAGLDKFFHLLTNWDQYLAPQIAQRSPIGGHNLMLVFGGVEIVAGLIVALWPRIGGWIVGFWLLGIVANLLLLGGYYDIALRDLGLAFGAFAMARLGMAYDVRRRRAGRDTLDERSRGRGHVHVRPLES